MHGILRHLEAKGFPGAPRFLGLDDKGREVLTFLPGDVPNELGAFSDDQIAAAAELLHSLHNATTDCELRAGNEVVCHGDPSPCNCVFVDGVPSGFIDFDAAHPGTRDDDVGYAAWLWLDIGNNELAPEVQGQRLIAFLTAYDSAIE
ncbi:MAG: phosphotransferase, partial [Steroidobacteraceae bacterium]